MNNKLFELLIRDLETIDHQLYVEALENIININTPDFLAFLQELSIINEKLFFKIFQTIEKHKTDYYPFLPEIYSIKIEEYNEKIDNIIQEIKLEPDMTKKINTYWHLYMANSIAKLNQTDKIKELYNYILNEFKKSFSLPSIIPDNNSKTAYIFLNQYVSESHSISSIALTWTKLFEKFNIDSLIISCSPIKLPFIFQSEKLNYKWNKFLKFSESVEISKKSSIIEVLADPLYRSFYRDLIKQLNMSDNDIYFLCGHSCLHFDLLPFKNKYSIPAAMDEIANITTALNYILPEETGFLNLYNEKMNFIKGPKDFMIGEKYNFNFSPPKPDKERYKVCISSNHLYRELLDETLWSGIRKIIKLEFNFIVVLVGEVRSIDLIPKDLITNVYFAGPVNNLNEYLQEIDFFLNTNRDGGGTSARMAIRNGKPIITLPKGDVFQTILSKYHVDSLDESADFINKYLKDKKFKEKIDKINKKIRDEYSKSNKELEILVKNIISN